MFYQVSGEAIRRLFLDVPGYDGLGGVEAVVMGRLCDGRIGLTWERWGAQCKRAKLGASYAR